MNMFGDIIGYVLIFMKQLLLPYGSEKLLQQFVEKIFLLLLQRVLLFEQRNQIVHLLASIPLQCTAFCQIQILYLKKNSELIRSRAYVWLYVQCMFLVLLMGALPSMYSTMFSCFRAFMFSISLKNLVRSFLVDMCCFWITLIATFAMENIHKQCSIYIKIRK